ncbi:MAG: ABC transporter permease subunit [Planctomycetota bacterium]
MTHRNPTIARLHRNRPRCRFARYSGLLAVVLTIVAWSTGGFRVTDVFSERRRANLSRFFDEATPAPLRDDDAATTFTTWMFDLLADPGLQAMATTLAIAVAAIVLAATVAALLVIPASRNIANAEPFLPSGRPPSLFRRAGWSGVTVCTRFLLTFLRAIPDYVWAFLFIALLGAHAWPAVLALALHNIGILGRLGAEVVENSSNQLPGVLRGLGGSRAQIAAVGLAPVVLPRFLLYFFYRWETCVREATILGMLGFSSLGFWINDARVRQNIDTMLFFIVLGAALVLAGDVLSAIARHYVRRAS